MKHLKDLHDLDNQFPLLALGTRAYTGADVVDFLVDFNFEQMLLFSLLDDVKKVEFEEPYPGKFKALHVGCPNYESEALTVAKNFVDHSKIHRVKIKASDSVGSFPKYSPRDITNRNVSIGFGDINGRIASCVCTNSNRAWLISGDDKYDDGDKWNGLLNWVKSAHKSHDTKTLEVTRLSWFGKDFIPAGFILGISFLVGPSQHLLIDRAILRNPLINQAILNEWNKEKDQACRMWAVLSSLRLVPLADVITYLRGIFGITQGAIKVAQAIVPEEMERACRYRIVEARDRIVVLSKAFTRLGIGSTWSSNDSLLWAMKHDPNHGELITESRRLIDAVNSFELSRVEAKGECAFRVSIPALMPCKFVHGLKEWLYAFSSFAVRGIWFRLLRPCEIKNLINFERHAQQESQDTARILSADFQDLSRKGTTRGFYPFESAVAVLPCIARVPVYILQISKSTVFSTTRAFIESIDDGVLEEHMNMSTNAIAAVHSNSHFELLLRLGNANGGTQFPHIKDSHVLHSFVSSEFAMSCRSGTGIIPGSRKRNCHGCAVLASAIIKYVLSLPQQLDIGILEATVEQVKWLDMTQSWSTAPDDAGETLQRPLDLAGLNVDYVYRGSPTGIRRQALGSLKQCAFIIVANGHAVVGFEMIDGNYVIIDPCDAAYNREYRIADIRLSWPELISNTTGSSQAEVEVIVASLRPTQTPGEERPGSNFNLKLKAKGKSKLDGESDLGMDQDTGFLLGERVAARKMSILRGTVSETYFPATITCVHTDQTIDLNYETDDSDIVEFRVDSKLIRPWNDEYLESHESSNQESDDVMMESDGSWNDESDDMMMDSDGSSTSDGSSNQESTEDSELTNDHFYLHHKDGEEGQVGSE